MFKNVSMKIVDNDHEKQLDNEQLIAIIHRLVDERDVLCRENEYLKARLNQSILLETINEIRKERDLLLKLLLNLSTNNNEQLQHQNHCRDEHLKVYSNDLLPPHSYQTFNTTLNNKSISNNTSLTKKFPAHFHRNHTPMSNRDLPILTTESKPSRRLHKIKQNLEPSQQQRQPTVIYRVEGTKECLMNPDELSSVFAHVKQSHPNKKIVVYKTSATPQADDFNQLVDEMCIKHGVELKHSHNSPFKQYRSQSLQDLTSSTELPHQRNFDYQFQPIERQEQIRNDFKKP